MLINIFSSRPKIINTPTIDAKQKDGALHMVGSLADVLLKKKIFKDQVESLLSTYVFPEFQSPHGNYHLLVLPNPPILLSLFLNFRPSPRSILLGITLICRHQSEKSTSFNRNYATHHQRPAHRQRVTGQS
jgi:hypothetical protein